MGQKSGMGLTVLKSGCLQAELLPGSSRGRPASLLIQLVGRSQFLVVVGLRPLFPSDCHMKVFQPARRHVCALPHSLAPSSEPAVVDKSLSHFNSLLIPLSHFSGPVNKGYPISRTHMIRLGPPG